MLHLAFDRAYTQLLEEIRRGDQFAALWLFPQNRISD